MTLLQRFTSILKSEENKDGDESGRKTKIPPGFEKILKRTKRGMTHSQKEEKEASAGEQKEEDKKAKEEEAEQSEQEEEPKTKKTKPNTGSKSGNYFRDFMIDPQNGGPNWENFLKLALLGGLIGYYAWISQSQSEEITY